MEEGKGTNPDPNPSMLNMFEMYTGKWQHLDEEGNKQEIEDENEVIMVEEEELTHKKPEKVEKKKTVKSKKKPVKKTVKKSIITTQLPISQPLQPYSVVKDLQKQKADISIG